jgi:hypothetical protein
MLTRVPTNTIAIPKALTLCVKIRRAGLNCLRRPLCYSSFGDFRHIWDNGGKLEAKTTLLRLLPASPTEPLTNRIV